MVKSAGSLPAGGGLGLRGPWGSSHPQAKVLREQRGSEWRFWIGWGCGRGPLLRCCAGTTPQVARTGGGWDKATCKGRRAVQKPRKKGTKSDTHKKQPLLQPQGPGHMHCGIKSCLSEGTLVSAAARGGHLPHDALQQGSLQLPPGHLQDTPHLSFLPCNPWQAPGSVRVTETSHQVCSFQSLLA